MAELHPYLHFNGNAEEAFHFYRSIFGGEFGSFKRFAEADTSQWRNAAEESFKVMHVALPIGKSSLLMGSDTPAFMGRHSEAETRSKISVIAETKEEATRIFEGLARGGTVEMPLEESPWGSYFGMLRDQYGIEWMVDYSPS